MPPVRARVIMRILVWSGSVDLNGKVVGGWLSGGSANHDDLDASPWLAIFPDSVQSSRGLLLTSCSTRIVVPADVPPRLHVGTFQGTNRVGSGREGHRPWPYQRVVGVSH